MIAQAVPNAASASSSLLQYGAIGACLIFAIIGIIFLFKYIKYKDSEISRINENRVEASTKAIEVVMSQGEKMKALIDLNKEANETLKQVSDKLTRLLAGRRSDDGND